MIDHKPTHPSLQGPAVASPNYPSRQGDGGSDEMSLPMLNVLVIEDSQIQIRLIQEMLAEAGDSRFAVSIAQDLKAGLQQLSTNTFDAVLLDLTLPDSSGIESCTRVNELAPSVPIVVLTGLDDEELAVSTLQHGAEDYLAKDRIDSLLLSRAIRYAIERKKAQLALKAAHDELERRVDERTAELRRMQEEAAERREELAHASRLNTLGEMASGLAHELNQPLMAIIGFTDHCLHLLQSGRQDTTRCIETVTDAAKEAKRAGEIIKRMRRLVSKRASNHTATDLNETVEEAVQLLRPGLDVAVSLDLDNSLPPARIDRVQVQQVIINVARNAVQAMKNAESATCELTLRTGKVDDKNQLFVEVSDTGPGLPEEDLERLFNPFFTRKPDGLGLGLSISRTLVESHGGKLTVSQNQGAGLTFRFTLPPANDANLPSSDQPCSDD